MYVHVYICVYIYIVESSVKNHLKNTTARNITVVFTFFFPLPSSPLLCPTSTVTTLLTESMCPFPLLLNLSTP